MRHFFTATAIGLYGLVASTTAIAEETTYAAWSSIAKGERLHAFKNSVSGSVVTILDNGDLTRVTTGNAAIDQLENMHPPAMKDQPEPPLPPETKEFDVDVMEDGVQRKVKVRIVKKEKGEPPKITEYEGDEIPEDVQEMIDNMPAPPTKPDSDESTDVKTRGTKKAKTKKIIRYKDDQNPEQTISYSYEDNLTAAEISYKIDGFKGLKKEQRRKIEEALGL